MATGTVNATLSEWLVVLLLVFSLLLELSLHHLEHWLQRRHARLLPALRIIYRELMVLGTISFLFLTYQQIASPVGDVVLSFEFAHVFIFLLAIVYTLAGLFSLYTSLSLSARWKRMESLDLPAYVASKHEYTRLRLRMHARRHPIWRALRWWWPDIRLLARHRYLHELMAFHDTRFQFIFYRHLPETFHFCSFLRTVKSHLFIQLVDSHWTLNVLFLLGVLADLGRRYIFGKVGVAHSITHTTTRADSDPTAPVEQFKNDLVEPITIMFFSLCLIILSQLLALKIRAIFWKLTKNPRLYYPHDSPTLPSSTPASGSSQEKNPVITTLPTSPLRLQDPALASPILANATRAVSIDAPPLPRSMRPTMRPRRGTSVDSPRPPTSTSFALDRFNLENPPTVQTSDVSLPFTDEVAPRDAESQGSDAPAADAAAALGLGDHAHHRRHHRHHLNALLRNKSLAVTGHTMEKHREHKETAQRYCAQSGRSYPWIVRKLAPRLMRVPTPAEKLFWFGSHTFFFWCIEFNLFFSTVFLASSLAGLFLLWVGNNPVIHVNIAAAAMAFATLMFVLLRSADILKKYTFVLLIASLLPDELTDCVIQDVSAKAHGHASGAGNNGSDSEEKQMDEGWSRPTRRKSSNLAGLSALRRRKTITQFIRTEMESGEIIEPLAPEPVASAARGLEKSAG